MERDEVGLPPSWLSGVLPVLMRRAALVAATTVGAASTAFVANELAVPPRGGVSPIDLAPPAELAAPPVAAPLPPPAAAPPPAPAADRIFVALGPAPTTRVVPTPVSRRGPTGPAPTPAGGDRRGDLLGSRTRDTATPGGALEPADVRSPRQAAPDERDERAGRRGADNGDAKGGRGGRRWQPRERDDDRERARAGNRRGSDERRGPHRRGGHGDRRASR